MPPGSGATRVSAPLKASADTYQLVSLSAYALQPSRKVTPRQQNGKAWVKGASGRPPV
jgi:hypothetical protein